MKHYIYTFLFLLVSHSALSQIPATIVKENTYTITTADGDVKLQATQSITLKPSTWIKSGSTFIAQIAENTTATDPYTSFSFSNENYVFSRSFQAPMTSFNAATAKEGDVTEQITYFDGLGRPMQSIGIKASPNDKKDIIRHIDYDDYGRQDKDWLPYYEDTGSVGSYRGDTSLATQQYYQTNYTDDFVGVTLPEDINAYSGKGFEASPLNRVLQQGAPGKDWKLGANNEIEYVYDSNILNEVRQYEVAFIGNNPEAPQLTGGTTYYTAGELYKTIIKDENHDGTTSKAHTTEEFKDKQGRVILKRAYGTSIVNEISQINTAHDTYYVYDDYGSLTYVLPPKSEPNTGLPDDAKLSELCYQYKYDLRNRLVEKKIPGKDWEYIVYDNLDRPLMTQDANLRTQNQWLFTKYDVFGRIVYTGLHTNTVQTTRLTMQAHFNSENDLETELYETKVTSGTGYDNSYYNNTNFPDTNIVLHTINYYDNYSFDGFTTFPASHDGQVIINNDNAISKQKDTKGLATGSKVRVLDSNPVKWITTITGYDVKGRPIYITSTNDYLGTTDVIKNTLDFIGKVDKTETEHTKNGTTITTVNAFVYDHENRLLRQKQTINNLAQETIVDNTYGNLGQLETKGVGGKSSNASRLQDVDYTYNVRGWLKQINNPTTLGSDLFGFKINYNTVDHNATKLYNGNIAETEWKTANIDNGLKWYKYTYDALNRITRGDDNTGKYDVYGILYDKNGNLTALKRDGHTNVDATSFGLMDHLAYSYDEGNKLIKMSDYGNDTKGFKDDYTGIGNDSSDDYTYDANGNMLTDSNKDILSNITYNHLNLPTFIPAGQNENISYIYDAIGNKLQKKVHIINQFYISNKYTDYANGYVYEYTCDDGGCNPSILKFFNHSEGYVETEFNPYSNSLTAADYVYQYKDHLGNIRLSYKDSNNNGAVDTSEILEENNYYPFGLKHKGYNNNVNSTNIALKKKFGGNELNDELGLDWYDVSARNYDASLGRWMNIDPLAEEMRRHSPYNYAFDNPVYYVDPDGMMPIPHQEDKSELESWQQYENPYHITSTVVNGKGEIIDYKDDGDNNIYLNERSAKNIIGTEREGVEYNVGGYLVDDDLNEGAMANLPNGFLIKLSIDIEQTQLYFWPAEVLNGGLVKIGSWLSRIKWLKWGKKLYSNKMLKAFQKQLQQHGKSSLTKSQRKIQRRLTEHLKKLKEIKKAGGHASSVEREINTFKAQLQAIKDVLK